ncbi:MAG: plasmid stabilization protein [candidate division SR1 bacterium]|nr:plasmid stabilization protein [candidate division SR1 bacterium]
MKKWIKYIRTLPSKLYDRIIHDIDLILSGKREGLDIKKLEGQMGMYRYRIGDIRIIFKRKGNTIEIITIGPRGDVYK